MKTETRTNKSVRILSLLTLLTVLITGLGLTKIVNAGENLNLGQLNINSSVHGTVRYYEEGDKLQVSGKILNVTAGTLRLRVEIKKSFAGAVLKSAEDEIPYVNGPDVSVNEFDVNAQLAKYKLPAGTYTCKIMVANKPAGKTTYNYAFKYFEDFIVVATNTPEYDFVDNHVGPTFGSYKGDRLYYTEQLKARKIKASKVAYYIIKSYLTRNPNCDATKYVTNLYNALLYRAPDAAGLKYWVDEIKSGRRSRLQVAEWWTSGQNQEFVKLLANKKLYN